MTVHLDPDYMWVIQFDLSSAGKIYAGLSGVTLRHRLRHIEAQRQMGVLQPQSYEQIIRN